MSVMVLMIPEGVRDAARHKTLLGVIFSVAIRLDLEKRNFNFYKEPFIAEAPLLQSNNYCLQDNYDIL